MTLVDANILIYAYSHSFPQHHDAQKWLQDELESGKRLGIPWESILAFMRILSNPRIVEHPETPSALWIQAQEWLNYDPVWIPVAGKDHAHCLSKMIPHAIRHTLVPDAHLAALALEHGLTLISTDGDFARFPDLQWHNPLLEECENSPFPFES